MGRGAGGSNGVVVHPKVVLPAHFLKARTRSVKVPQGVTPLGQDPVWFKIDAESGWHGTVRPLPGYAGEGYVAFVSRKKNIVITLVLKFMKAVELHPKLI